MPIQKISLETLQKIRQHLQSTLVLPDLENNPQARSSFAENDEPPEPDSLSDLGTLFNFGGPEEFETHAPNTNGKWFISSTDPATALVKLPGISLKSGIRLVSYLYRMGENGSGVTWAIPEMMSTTAQLEKAIDLANNSNPPHPESALTNVMDAIKGDRSPASFLIASLLGRELKEFGAIGKSCNWSHHRLINALPTQVKWEWRIKQPQDLSPKVLIHPDQRAVIEFFTCRVTAPVAIFQHIDQYPADGYTPASTDRPIATPQRTK